MRTNLPSNTRRRNRLRITTLLLSPNKNRNNSPSTKTKSPMSQNPQDRRDLTRMRRNRDESIILLRLVREKYLVQGCHTPYILRSTSLPRNPVPKFILLTESLLNTPLGEEVIDVSFASTVVACMNAYSLAEKFFYEGIEWCCVCGER